MQLRATAALHPVLAAAVAGARLRAFTPRFDGPAAAVAPAHLARLGLWCAEWIERGVPAAAREEFAASLAEARALIADPAQARAWQYSQGNTRYPTEHLSVARLAAAAARRAVRNPAATSVALCAAVKLVARLERAAAEARLRGFLGALEAELVRLEAAAAVADRIDPELGVAAVLWRGVEEGRVASWLVRLTAARRYGLLARVAGRWRWFEGGRDDVLSNVPDRHFEQAVKSALAYDLSA